MFKVVCRVTDLSSVCALLALNISLLKYSSVDMWGLNMSLHSHDCASSLCHYYFLAFSPVVFHSMAPYSFTCPQSPIFHCTATVDPLGRKEIFLQVSTSLLIWGCLFISTVWLPSSLSHTMGGLLNLGSMPFDGLLNKTSADWWL